jgi:hypothetical protein
VYAYVQGKGKRSSAITKKIIENDLIEEFHWLPQDIEKIPYRKMQEFLIIRREKRNARNAQAAVENFKQQANASAAQSSGRGQHRRRR